MTLTILTHVSHFRKDNRLYALAPYVKEINTFAACFERIIIVAPVKESDPTGECIPYAHESIEIIRAPLVGGPSVRDKLRLLLSIPAMATAVMTGVVRGDLIHIRCPGNIGLIGAMVIGWSRKPRFAKYAGEWGRVEGEGITLRLQKALLRRSGFGGIVTYYGDRDPVRPHLEPFYTSTMTEEEVRTAVRKNMDKVVSRPVKIVFAGRLEPNKGVTVLTRAMGILHRKHPDMYHLTICGDGSERRTIESRIAEEQLTDCVTMTGWVNQETLFSLMSQSHFLCQPSLMSESWGKTIQEAMAHGVIPLASDIGGLRTQLSDMPYLLCEPGNAEVLAEKVLKLSNDAEEYGRIQTWGFTQASQHTIDRLGDDLIRLLENRLSLRLRP